MDTAFQKPRRLAVVTVTVAQLKTSRRRLIFNEACLTPCRSLTDDPMQVGNCDTGIGNRNLLF